MPDFNVNGGYGHHASHSPGATPRPAPEPERAEVVVSVVRADQPQPGLPPGSAG